MSEMVNVKDIDNFIPLKDFKLVKFEKVEHITESGIITQVSKRVIDDRPTKGVVIKEGPESKYKLLGKTVYFDKTIGQDINYENGYLLLKEDSILGYE